MCIVITSDVSSLTHNIMLSFVSVTFSRSQVSLEVMKLIKTIQNFERTFTFVFLFVVCQMQVVKLYFVYSVVQCGKFPC